MFDKMSVGKERVEHYAGVMLDSGLIWGAIIASIFWFLAIVAAYFNLGNPRWTSLVIGGILFCITLLILKIVKRKAKYAIKNNVELIFQEMR